MNRRGFLAGVAAALGLAKAGALGAEEVPEVVLNPDDFMPVPRWHHSRFQGKGPGRPFTMADIEKLLSGQLRWQVPDGR